LNAWNFAKIDFKLEIWTFFHINRAVFLKNIVKLNELLHRVQRPKKRTHLKSGLRPFLSNQTCIKENRNLI